MKYLIILLLLFSCCTTKKPVVVEPPRIDTVRMIVRDTVIIRDTVFKDQKELISDLNKKLFLSNYKIERVRYYLKICQRKPSQVKFLVSWINRAIN